MIPLVYQLIQVRNIYFDERTKQVANIAVRIHQQCKLTLKLATGNLIGTARS